MALSKGSSVCSQTVVNGPRGAGLTDCCRMLKVEIQNVGWSGAWTVASGNVCLVTEGAVFALDRLRPACDEGAS